MFEQMIENGKYTQCEPKKEKKMFEIPLRSGLLISLQKAVQMERQWEQNADCV